MVKVEKDSAGKATVTIYASVGDEDFNGASFQALLDGLDGCSEIMIMLHTYGGEVFEGNLIKNAIAASAIPIDITIAGVCASMGSVIVQAARRLLIVDNGFMMIHVPSGYTEGSAAQHLAAANLLQSMEKQIAIDLGTRTGKDAKYTAKWLDGQDHWMDAETLLTEGLVDEIVPATTKAPEILTVEAAGTLGAKAVYSRFTALLNSAPPTPNDTKKTMDKQKLIDKYKLTGVTADSTDEQVEAALEAHISGIQTKAGQTTDEVIEALVDEAVGPKITAEQKPHFVAVGKSAGVATLKNVLGAIKPYASVTDAIKNHGTPAPDAKLTEGWDWDKYQKENPKALQVMQNADYAKFNALYKAKYGTDAPK